MLIQIKSWLTKEVIFEGQYGNFSQAVVDAVRVSADLSRAYLPGADLSCTDLSCANLSGADLSGANLSGANLDSKYCFLSISPIGSENGCLWVMRNEAGVLMYNRGCFSDTEEQFVAAVKAKHAGTEYERKYMTAVEFIKSQVGDK